MSQTLDHLHEEPESDELEKKSSLDPSNSKDMLGLIADVVAMANTKGGKLLIGTRGAPIPENQVKLFDSARVDDKVNSFAEPIVAGIKSAQLGKDFILIEIEKSKSPPHVMKKEGNYNDPEKGQLLIFRSRDILVRHSSKTERATRSDLDRMFTERQQTLFEKVKMVFEAPSGSRIEVVEEGLGVPVRIDPEAADARPIYDVLTSSPFRDMQQELIGAVKSWKTSHQLLNETQIMKAYVEKDKFQDPEVLELLLRSSWERHIPGCFWAARIGAGPLPGILEEGIRADAFPGSLEALRIASLLPRALATKLFTHAQQCKKRSVSKMIKRLEPVLRARTRKYDKLIEIFYPWRKITYLVPGGTKAIEFEKADEAILNELTLTVLGGTKENRSAFKTVEMILYAQNVANLPFPEGIDGAEIGDAPIDVNPGAPGPEGS
jgi:hypothetical protein